MRRLFNNPEIKKTTVMLIILQFILAASVFMFTSRELSNLNKTITLRNTALLGKIMDKYPKIAEEYAGLITREITAEDIERGHSILKQYGYDQDMEVYCQPYLNKYYYSMPAKISVIVLAGLFPLVLITVYGAELIYSRVRIVSEAAEEVVDGMFDVQLPEEREGELDILNHRFNQMAYRLKMSLQTLQSDKTFLKNIISDISHQLKTPLSSLMVFNELLLGDNGVDDETRKTFLIKSRQQLERMEWLIINLLKMARLEAGAISFEKSKIQVVEAVKKALSSLSVQAEQKELTIRLTGNDVENARVTADEEWLSEAFTNILKNSIEHSETGGKIEVNISQTPLFIRITISDNGEGIDKKDLPHVFERFYRGSNSVKAQSIGIGLALAKLIIEGHGGSISVKSQKGKGTSFTITFLKTPS